MTGIDPVDVYPLYVEFQTRLRDHAIVASRAEYSRSHYRRVFHPAPRELFEARLERMSYYERAHQVRVWQAGFEAWLAIRLKEFEAGG